MPKEFFKPVRYTAAACIAIGGSMHALGMILSVMDHQSFPWWFWAIFLIAIPGYLVSAVMILKNMMPGYLFAFGSPIVGGTLIFFGFLFPESRLLILIPGTYGNEITLLGFFTLLSEPVAVILAALCIRHKVWGLS